MRSTSARPTRFAVGRGHGEIQDLALVGRLERDDVAYNRAGSFRLGDEKVRIGRHAVAKVLCGPRVGEDLLLDRADRGDIAELSGTNVVGSAVARLPFHLCFSGPA